MTPRAVLDHFDRGTLWPALVDDARPTDLAAAYRAALAVRTLRIARGERPVGYKVGFTNRTLWDRYRVYAPIWGVVWDTTLQSCDGTGRVSLQRICQPRLEPEVAFGLRATPPVGATLEQLYDCVDWLSPSFELVQSHCADWTFTAAQTVIDGGLHARLLLGPRTLVRDLAASGETLDAMLAALRVRLFKGDALIDEGHGCHVLDGPLHALLHFVQEHQRCPGAPTLVAGDVVTTGTWTDAFPVRAHERWRSEFDAPLGGLAIELA